MTSPNSALQELRRTFLRSVCRNILGRRSSESVLSNADKNSTSSKAIAETLADQIGFELCPTPPRGRRSGHLLGEYVRDYLEASFARLSHIRPGKWIFSTSQSGDGVALCGQYEHLPDLARAVRSSKELEAALGGDYLITPDVIIARCPVEDAEFNAREEIVNTGENLGEYTSLRAENARKRRFQGILHASISCKWTIRSDRVQNTRTEALNLIRNRKGKTPHVVAVTFEPMPTRLASIALGTGDVDCTYHGALAELIAAVDQCGSEDQADMLDTLVNGCRLRDISDLPFDLIA